GADLAGGKLVPSAEHPPGYYGREGSTVAFNAVSRDTRLVSLASAGLPLQFYAEDASIEFKWPLLFIARFLIALAAILSLLLRGHIALARAPAAAATLLLAVSLLYFQPAHAAEDQAKITASALDTKLAYVVTGDSSVDEMSRAGLFGLGLA